MSKTLQSEMDEDAKLYDKLACWCNNNKYEKAEAISEAEARSAELSSTSEGLVARVSELKTSVDQLNSDVAASKEALDSASALREKEAAQVHSSELDSLQAIENLKAAIEVLSKHHEGAALPQLSLALPTASFLAVRGTGRKGRDGPWSDAHESPLARSFDEFLEQHGLAEEPRPASKPAVVQTATKATSTDKDGWSAHEKTILQRALRSAAAFTQTRRGEEAYYPSYKARSGEIMGLLKELKEQMEADLSEAQKVELEKKTNFEELRSSKVAEIEAAHAQAEKKEDELAEASMALAEAKEDLAQTEAILAEHRQFAATLKETCEDGDANFETRKNARLAEIQAVSDAIAILSADEARDTMSRTYSLIQLRATHMLRRRASGAVATAAALLKRASARAGSPELSIMATKVELDSFSRVKKAIDDMVAMLQQQQADEVKKNDWCTSSLHENEVAMAKVEEHKDGLEAKLEDLADSAAKIEDEVSKALQRIAQLQVDLQRASENRAKENMDFQSTVADQRATQGVLKTALQRLAAFYKEEEFVQVRKAQGKARHGQTPPMAQKEYKPSAGGGNVMSLIEKLIQDAKELEAEALRGENSAQAQYEALVADTNAAVAGLQKEVAFKKQSKAQASAEHIEKKGDLADTVEELQGLDRYESELHSECDYLTKNFEVRQTARAQEVEALKQAKQILSGADFS